MALPTLDKSWIFKTNILLPTTGAAVADHQQLLLAIKQALTVATGWTDSTGATVVNAYPWTVSASSNGTVADTNDNWNSTSDLVYGANISWIVLRQAQINAKYEICLSRGPTNYYYYVNTYVSHNFGFDLTGLLTTTPPTATDRIQHHSTGYITGVTSATADYSMTVAMSTDGQCRRVMIYTASNFRTLWIWDKPKNPVTGWLNPSICLMQSNGGTLVPSAYTELTDYAQISSWIKGLGTWLYTTTEFYGTAALGENLAYPNQVTGEWQLDPLGLASASSGRYGRHGEIFDLWYTSTALTQGVSLPSSSNRQFMVLPYLVHPWNRSVLIPT
jgi:hypothetical protein